MKRPATIAYLVDSGRKISPFGWSVKDAPVQNAPLGERQTHAFRRAGCQVERIESLDRVKRFPCLIALDDLFFTPSAVRRFTASVARQIDNGAQSPVHRAALEVGPLTERFAPALQGELLERHEPPLRLYDLFHVAKPTDLSSTLEQGTPTPIPYRVARVGGRTHRRFDVSGRFDIPVSLVFLSPVRHWADLVVCNAMAMASHIYETARSRPWSSLLLPLAAVARAASLRRHALRGKLYFNEKKTKIHPSAHLEGVVLAPRVRIGPNAAVRFCSVGRGAHIGAGAVVEGCSIGARATINPQVVLRGCMIGDEAAIGSYFMQMSAIGHSAVMCPDSGILDFNLRGQVPVRHQGETIRLGSSLMGGAVGDDAFLGPKVSVSFGCEIPNGCVLIQSPRHYVREVGPGKSLPENVLRMDRGRGRAA